MKKLLLNIQMFAKIPTAGTHELRDRFSDILKKLFRKTNNVRQFFGTDAQGDPKAGAVKIPVRDTEVSIADYNVTTGTPLTTGATVFLNVLVNKNKAINEIIDGFEAAAVPDPLIAQRLDSAAFILQRTKELDGIAILRDSTLAQDTGGGQTGPANPTYETSTTVLSASTAYNAISATIGEFLDVGVDPEDIVVAISTDTETFLLEDVKYTNTASEAGSQRAKDGIINMIRGAIVTRSSNLGVVAAAGANVALNGNTVEYIVFSPLWAQKGDEWMVSPSLKDLTNTFIGSSAVQGREIYFNVLTDTKGSRVKTTT